MSETPPYPQAQITGVVLAGGRARRMGGGDKGLALFNGRPMAAHVVAALQPQCVRVIINANRNHDDYAALGCEVVADHDSQFNGPLAGIARGLECSNTPWTLFAPCDSPLASTRLGPLLWAALADADIAMAAVGERTHPVFALMRTSLADSVKQAMDAGERKIDRWYTQHATIVVSLPQIAESFLNVNRPEDLAELEHRACSSPKA
jgi:molybdenum cofactor guanylyltransferase